MASLGFRAYQQSLVWKDTESLFRNVLVSYPDSDIAHNNLGDLYRSQGKLDQAMAEANALLTIRPAEAHNNIANVLLASGDLDGAAKELQASLAVHPDAKVYNNLGNVYRIAGMIDAAIQEHRRALALDPDSAEAYGGLGLIDEQIGKLAEAETLYRRALALSGWIACSRTAQYQLANLCHLGFVAKAPVRSTGPHFPYVYYATNRGVQLVREAYDQLGQPRELSVAEDVHGRGHAFTSILHELMLTEFALGVHLAVAQRPDVRLAFSERRFFRRDRQLRYFVDGRIHRVDPDYGLLLHRTTFSQDRQAEQLDRGTLFLVEWDNGTMSLARIRDKYRHYAAWADSEWGRAQLRNLFSRNRLSAEHANFRLLVIAHDKAREYGDAARMTDLLAEAIELPAKMRDRIWLTTAEALTEEPTDRPAFELPIWFRAQRACG